MKSRKSAATPRSSNLDTMRSAPDVSECSTENLFEHLKYLAEKPVENSDTINAIASKLYLKLTSQDKAAKDKVLDKLRRGRREFYPLFLKMIEIASNLRSVANVIGLLYESLNSKNVVHKNLGLKLTSDLDATSVLLRSLIHHDVIYLSEHLTQLVWILGQMSWRDSRFLVKMRKISHGVKVFHNLLKLRQSHHSAIFLPTLYCLKTLTKSPFLGNILVRDGIAVTIETILTSIGSAISVKLKLILTIMLNLTKNNTFIKKMTKLGMTSHLLLVFDRWLKFNTNKKFKMCHLVLCILHKIVLVSKPSRSLISCDVFYRFCSSLPDDSSHYLLISKTFCILNICSGNKCLPVTHVASPVTFELPIIETTQLNSDDEDDDNDSDEEELYDTELDPDPGEQDDLMLDDEDTDNEELNDCKKVVDAQSKRENVADFTKSKTDANEFKNQRNRDSQSKRENVADFTKSKTDVNEFKSQSDRNRAQKRNDGKCKQNPEQSCDEADRNDENTPRNSIKSRKIVTGDCDSPDLKNVVNNCTNIGANNLKNSSTAYNNNHNNKNSAICTVNNVPIIGNLIKLDEDVKTDFFVQSQTPDEKGVEVQSNPLFMYAQHFQEFNSLIPNTKENSLSPPLGRIVDSSDVTSKSTRRTLRSLLDLGNSVTGPDSNCNEFGMPRLVFDQTAAPKSGTNLRVLQGIKSSTKLDRVFRLVANQVHSVVPHVKLAYPDLHLISGVDKSPNFAEPLHVENKKNVKNKMLKVIDRMQNPEKLLNTVVYDFDLLYWIPQNTTPITPPNSDPGPTTLSLSNHDPERLGVRECGNSKSLYFESRFECGNLRKAIQVGPYEYDLILMPDVNSNHHHQWFYFEVYNMDAQATYTLNIVNQEKHHSQYQHGMKPVMFSVKEATCGRGLWTRAGTDICYYRNSYVSSRNQRHSGRKSSRAAFKNHHEFYYTLSFNVKFKHSLDVCYLAYHYPYSYTYMMTTIWKLGRSVNPRTILYRCESLCDSLNNNQVPVITITACDSVINRIEDRQLIVLTSRVHPGESNASWLLDGLLTYLASEALSAAKLRSKYVLKIVPMLNVEGVVNGCHRCGLTNEDLNRKWKTPHPLLHPEIFHTKGLIEFSHRVLKKSPYFYCDFHGHSLKKNVFLYGCSNQESWLPSDRSRPENPVEFRMLSRLLEQCSLTFDPKSSHYKIEKSKESTARVTVWREYGVTRSYTMESTYCGFDQGTFKETHINIGHLREMGSSVCVALAALFDETQYMIGLIRNSDNLLSEDFCRSRFKYMIENNSSTSLDKGVGAIHPNSEVDDEDEEEAEDLVTC